MSSSVIESGDATVVPLEILQARKREVAKLLAEAIAGLHPTAQKMFPEETSPATEKGAETPAIVEEKAADIMIELDNPDSEVEDIVGDLKAAIDDAEGEEVSKVAVKAMLDNTVALFMSLKRNQMDEPTYHMLIDVITRLRDMLKDGKISREEVSNLQSLDKGRLRRAVGAFAAA